MKEVNHQQSGFTLIEIMIVISIMSVLAMVGFSSYKQALNKAKNERKIVNLKNATNVISAYTISNGALPGYLEDARNNLLTYITCLGKSTHDTDNDGLTDCHIVSTGGYEEESTLNTAMGTVSSSRPLVDDAGVNFGASGTFWGATLAYFDDTTSVTVNGVERRLWLQYGLLGRNQTCESFGGEVVDGGTLPAWTSSSPSNRGLQINGNTLCYVALTQEFGR